MQTFRILVLITFTASLLSSCNNTTKQDTQNVVDSKLTTMNPKYRVKSPSPLLEQQAEIKMISSKQGGTITFSNGTQLTIPANAFLCEGKAVQDSVQISLKQFDDVFDIFGSGIPMQYDSAGTSYTFSSAGMCEIDGSYNGKPLEFAPGKKVDVSMMSKFDDTDYSLYYFDTLCGEWIFKGKDTTVAIVKQDSAALQKAIQELKQKHNPQIPTQQAAKDMIPVRVYDINRFPKFKVFNSISFKIATEEFKRIDEIQSENWYEMEIDTSDKKNGSFLTLIGDLKKVEVKGDLFLDGEIYTKAMLHYPAKKKEYDRKQRIRDSLQRVAFLQQQMALKASKATRDFAISGFGIWNCDRPMLAEGVAIRIQAGFQKNPQDTILEFGIAYVKYNAVLRQSLQPNENRHTYINAKILYTQHIFYASDQKGDLYIAKMNESISAEVREKRPAYPLEITLEKIENPELFYEDLKNQTNTKLEAMAGRPINWN